MVPGLGGGVGRACEESIAGPRKEPWSSFRSLSGFQQIVSVALVLRHLWQSHGVAQWHAIGDNPVVTTNAIKARVPALEKNFALPDRHAILPDRPHTCAKECCTYTTRYRRQEISGEDCVYERNKNIPQLRRIAAVRLVTA